MKVKIPFVFNLIFCLSFFTSVEAQTSLENTQIPDDLLITLKSEGKTSFAYSVITITATGDWSSKSYLELPDQLPSKIISNDGIKIRIPPEKLKFLISEFKKVQFFNNFSKEVLDKEKALSPTERKIEVISIRMTGQTKEISYYLGQGKQTGILRDLGEKIRGVGIWNLQDGKIPDNFQVWYRITDGDKILRDFKIESNGEVTASYHLSKFYPEVGKNLPVFVKSEKVGKLSKQQLIQLIDEFEKVGFSTFKYSPLSKYAGCLNEPILNEEKRKHINVQINHITQMFASLYEDCNPEPETDAAKFEFIANEIEKLLKAIQTIKK